MHTLTLEKLYSPFVCMIAVTLHLSYGGHAVKTPGHKYHVVQHFDSEITSRVGHAHYRHPTVRSWVKYFTGVHPSQSVEATDRVQIVVVCYARHATSSTLHWSYVCPLVHLHTVSLCRVHALLPTEPASYVYFVYIVILFIHLESATFKRQPYRYFSKY